MTRTREIRILPANIANMIAAGEVVQRPASVVKELMENAVDAGASQVDVFIQDAGRTLVQVIDNGCGMSPDEAVLCFERHATSKIAAAEDLGEILTFGFRGEALASIAAVSEVCLKTRREEDEAGCEVHFADSRNISTGLVQTPRGCNFQVRNLFYNIPARRKFLKSDNVEFKHISEEFTKVALTRPDIGFSLTHNGRPVYGLKPAKSLKFRAKDLLGDHAVDQIVEVETETTMVSVSGFAGSPESAKKTQNNQFFFVNGRYFRSPYFHKAIMKAYENLIPDGYNPSYFIYLMVDPHSVDVNISPTKTEMKFEDESVIFQTIWASVKEALGRNSFAPALDFDTQGSPAMPAISSRFDEFRPLAEPQPAFDPNYNPFENDGFSDDYDASDSVQLAAGGSFAGGTSRSGMPSPSDSRTSGSGENVDYGRYITRSDDYGKLFEDRQTTSRQVLLFQGRYIFAQTRTGVAVVNIRRARERILYERFIEALGKNSHVTQTTLFPINVYVGQEGVCTIAENATLLASLGFDMSPFGQDSIVVNGVPEGYSTETGKVEIMVGDLLLVLSEGHVSLEATLLSALAEKFAKVGAASADEITSPVQALAMVEELFSCDTPEYTSSGKKTLVIMGQDELDRRF
ncbi:MAG: DNA mismatch repair endonuclease MutL [Bacteroidales bacterium]|nr:DNA mismatch repair endonuclease MutL [Bacteroidales bacterium]